MQDLFKIISTFLMFQWVHSNPLFLLQHVHPLQIGNKNNPTIRAPNVFFLRVQVQKGAEHQRNGQLDDANQHARPNQGRCTSTKNMPAVIRKSGNPTYCQLTVKVYVSPGIPTAIKTMGVNITTIAYLRVSIIEIGSTIFIWWWKPRVRKSPNIL